MSFTFTGVEEMQANILHAVDEKTHKIILALNSVMAEMVNFMKMNHTFNDRTGNLRNSLGYVPAYIGVPEDATVSTGQVTGFDRIAKVQRTNKKDIITASGSAVGNQITGIIYAGMEYAIYVEYSDGRWVISGSFTEYRNKIMALIRERVEAQG